MQNLRALLLVCTLGAGLAACGDSSAPLAPGSPRFDGGITTLGSGARTADAGSTDEERNGSTIGSGGRTADAGSTTTDGTTAGRGGPYTVGSDS